MFFILSKLLIFLLSPAFWIVVLLLISFYIKNQRRKKIFRIISFILLAVFTNPFLFNVAVRAWQPEPVTLIKGQAFSTAILLGGITGLDKDDRSFFGTDADRFIQATRLYHSGAVHYIAVTGGSPNLFVQRKPEALQIKEALLQQGIPDSAIIVETLSRNTFENASFTKIKLDSLKLAPPYILITSAIHVPRAVAVFKKAGVNVIGYPSAYKQLNSKGSFIDWIIPSFDLLPMWTPLFKEIFGYAAYCITGKA